MLKNLVLMAAVTSIAVALVLLSYAVVCGFSAGPPAPSNDGVALMSDTVSLEIPPWCNPATLPARETNTHREARILGVEVQGQYRAYLLNALQGPENHIINDVVNGLPIIVTQCDVNQCTRVLTPLDGIPSEVYLAGWHGDMWIRVNGECFPQDSPRLPMFDYPFEITSWGEWSLAHPETDIFVGPLAFDCQEAAHS